MAFKTSKLHVSAYCGGHTAWVYTDPTDPLADKVQPGYFDAADDMLSEHDTIIITAFDGQAMRWVQKSDQDGVVLGKMS